MNKLIGRLVKLAVIATIIYAFYTGEDYYSLFLRWLVFVSSLYFAYSSRQISGIYGIFSLILFTVFAILFNPFVEFAFREITWRIIDIIVCVFYAATLDWKEYANSLLPKQKLIFKLSVTLFWGMVALMAAFWFVGSMMKINPYYEFLLITKSKTADGFIISSKEYEDVVEQEGRSSALVYDVYYEYTFSTKDGKIINDHASDQSSESGYLEEANEKPIPILVEYLSNKPTINRIKGMTGQADTVIEFIWRRLGLGMVLLLIFCSIGFTVIRNAIQEYLKEKEKITENTE